MKCITALEIRGRDNVMILIDFVFSKILNIYGYILSLLYIIIKGLKYF